MVVPVDAVADIMHVPCNFAEPDFFWPIPKIFENLSGGFCHLGSMFSGMFRKSENVQHLISFPYQKIYLFIFLYLSVSNDVLFLFCHIFCRISSSYNLVIASMARAERSHSSGAKVTCQQSGLPFIYSDA